MLPSQALLLLCHLDNDLVTIITYVHVFLWFVPRLIYIYGILTVVTYLYKLAWPRTGKNWPAFVTRLLTPRSRKSGYGLLLGCRSGFDGGREKKTFF